jgi:hypothetical protein
VYRHPELPLTGQDALPMATEMQAVAFRGGTFGDISASNSKELTHLTFPQSPMLF